MNDILLETRNVSKITGTFLIPSYQRGYRWNKEATRLLDDIMEIDQKSDYPYCLQPIVVKKMNDGRYELIDGQQRLTTLYLIYKVLKKYISYISEQFTLTYEVRERSETFLKNISEDSSEDNIDFYFIKTAYKAIDSWFINKMKEDISTPYLFSNLLTKRVEIIWYEISQEQDSNALFQRLNIGKIPLTSSELVKALFLCDSSKNKIDCIKRDEISLQWDTIEKELHNNSFWFFLTNKKINDYQTRIDLVLDLKANCNNKIDKYATFFYFDEYRKTNGLSSMWNEILHTYLIIKDWYCNHELYHLIGFLIAVGISINEIYRISLNKSKSEFINALNELIKTTVSLKGSNYGELSYDNQTEYSKIYILLLLFNVISTKNNGEQSQWFPFDKFKLNNWSLEHIHAQQSEGLKTVAQWKEWIKLHVSSVKLLGRDQELIDKMNDAIEDSYSLTDIEFREIREKVESILSDGLNVGYIHSISNLALLKREDNSALSNSTFDVKRNEIINMDKKGQFIPYCTKMVFLKYYTNSEGNQVHFWGQLDRICYIDNINSTLKEYIEPIVLNETENING